MLTPTVYFSTIHVLRSRPSVCSVLSGMTKYQYDKIYSPCECRAVSDVELQASAHYICITFAHWFQRSWPTAYIHMSSVTFYFYLIVTDVTNTTDCLWWRFERWATTLDLSTRNRVVSSLLFSPILHSMMSLSGSCCAIADHRWRAISKLSLVPRYLKHDVI